MPPGPLRGVALNPLAWLLCRRSRESRVFSPPTQESGNEAMNPFVLRMSPVFPLPTENPVWNSVWQCVQ